MAAGTAQNGCHSTLCPCPMGDKDLPPTNTACVSHETIGCTNKHTGAHRSCICVQTGALSAYQYHEFVSSQPTAGDSQVVYTVIPAARPQCCMHLLHPLPQPYSSVPAHASAGAAVSRQAWRPAQRHALRTSRGRRPRPALAQPWYPTSGFDAAPPCVRCALPSCAGSAVELLDGAHAAEAGHAGVHAQPGQRSVRAPAARASLQLKFGLTRGAVQLRMHAAGRGALQGVLLQAQIGESCALRAF